jgi:hypothetical protein
VLIQSFPPSGRWLVSKVGSREQVRVGVDPLVGFMEEKYSIIYCLSLQIFLYNMYDGV